VTDTPTGPSSSQQPPVEGNPTEVRQMLEAVEHRNSVLVRIAKAVEKLTSEVPALRRAIDDRPTKVSVAHRRRRSAVIMILFGFVIIWGHDQHVEHCSPGSQALAILDFAVNRPVTLPNGKPRPPLTQEQVQQVVEETTPSAACDVTFPLHTHGIEEKDAADYHVLGFHLSGWNLVGWLLYGLVGGILYAYQRGPGRSAQHRNSD
jgi:hypothetical protein